MIGGEKNSLCHQLSKVITGLQLDPTPAWQHNFLSLYKHLLYSMFLLCACVWVWVGCDCWNSLHGSPVNHFKLWNTPLRGGGVKWAVNTCSSLYLPFQHNSYIFHTNGSSSTLCSGVCKFHGLWHPSQNALPSSEVKQMNFQSLFNTGSNQILSCSRFSCFLIAPLPGVTFKMEYWVNVQSFCSFYWLTHSNRCE